VTRAAVFREGPCLAGDLSVPGSEWTPRMTTNPTSDLEPSEVTPVEHSSATGLTSGVQLNPSGVAPEIEASALPQVELDTSLAGPPV